MRALEADWWERLWLLDPCWEDGWGAWLCAGLGPPTGQLHKCGYKELFHRQLYQDLTGSELPEGVDIHHQGGNPANNMAKNLEPMPRSHATSQHFHGPPLFAEKHGAQDAHAATKNVELWCVNLNLYRVEITPSYLFISAIYTGPIIGAK